MEKLKEMCRNVQVRRASTDLYQTMLGCYEKSDSDFALKSKEDTDTLKACQKSKETLIKRNMVLAELVETERDYVDSLEVVVKVG